MDLDVAKLESELQGIYQERQAVAERIRNYVPGGGRGRGMGPPGALPVRGGPPPGRGAPGRGPYPRQPDFDGPGPSHHLPGPSNINRSSDWPPRNNGFPARPPRDMPRSSVMDRLGPRLSQDRRKLGSEPEPATIAATAAAEPAGSRKRLLSAVVVDGETRLPSQTDESMTAKRPKPDDVEDNPAAKKRNRRMFGFLNQTLQKCKDESSDFRQSKVAQQRDEALKRAEERRREELVKFKADFKREMAVKRQSEINLKKELNMQAEVKRAEIALVQRVLHRSKVANFIQTSAGPPLCWLPGKHNAATQSLLQKEQEKLEDFKGEEAVKLEVKRQQISENVAAMAKAAEAAAARRLAAAEAAAQQKEVAKTVASTVAITITAPQATADADMPAAGAAASEQDHDGGDVEDDEVEEGAYVVLDEEEEDNAEAAQQDNGKQPDRTANGSAAQLSDADDDRYVAEAYSAGEDHFDRSGNASREPTAQTDANAEQMETNQQPLDDKAEGVDQNAAHQQGPMSSSPAIGITDDPSNAQLEPLTQAEKVTHDKLTDMDTDLAGEEASPSDDAAEPMETEAK